MNARARNFLVANQASPVVYGSVADGCVTYRLADGKMFRLNASEARQAPNPRWAFHARVGRRLPKALRRHGEEEAALLARLTAESLSPELLPEGGR
ncbi:MAG TPA: hypothetical protein VLB05_05535 [Dongiaceae bacterium]|nr:hypothetical protein [Dongiaceae bacterium]